MSNMQLRKMLFSTTVLLIFVSGCFTILSVDQPATAKPGDEITVKMVVRTEEDPAWGLIDDGQFGILGIMMPEDWDVKSVWYNAKDMSSANSDLSPNTMEYLDPADPDKAPGGKVDYWTDSLYMHYPPPEGMMWIVYQSVNIDSTKMDTGYVDLYVQFTVGQKEGSFDLAYFVSMASLDWDFDNYYSYSPGHTITISTTALEEKQNHHPAVFSLQQNYPNPFNPVTTIRYELAGMEHVRLIISDLSGKTVATLADEVQDSGLHSLQFSGKDLSSGIYVYTLTAGNSILARKMVLCK